MLLVEQREFIKNGKGWLEIGLEGIEFQWYVRDNTGAVTFSPLYRELYREYFWERLEEETARRFVETIHELKQAGAEDSQMELENFCNTWRLVVTTSERLLIIYPNKVVYYKE